MRPILVILTISILYNVALTARWKRAEDRCDLLQFSYNQLVGILNAERQQKEKYE